MSESMWSVVVTMTTRKKNHLLTPFIVGYGDMHPRTDAGKFIIFLCSLVGIVVISMMVVAVNNKMDMSGLEAKAYTVINKVEIKTEMKKRAADVITKAAKVYLKVKKQDSIEVKRIFDFNDTITKFKHIRAYF